MTTAMITGDIEPVVAIDTSGSMEAEAAPNSGIPKFDVVTELLGTLVQVLGVEDSQAAREATEGEGKGGLLTFTFASTAREIGDLRPDNWRDEWKNVGVGGGTRITAAWREMEAAYQDEFGTLSATEQPNAFWLFVSDGEPQDEVAFEETLAKVDPSGNRYIAIAVIGYGPEHDQALAAYQRVAGTNPHVRVVSFDAQTSGRAIAQTVLELMGKSQAQPA